MSGLSKSAKITISLSQKVFILFGLLCLIIIFNFTILLKTQKSLKELNNWVLHTHEVIEESEKFLGYLRDAETGQRGFLLTLNQTYLEPFSIGIKQSDIEFDLLKKLTEDNLEQQTRLDQIQALVIEKKSELERTIKLAQEDKKEEALKIVNSDSGKAIMDSIRDYVGELISIEKDLLKQRNVSYLEEESSLINLFYFEAAILIIIIFTSYIFMRKNIVDPIKKMTEYFMSEEAVLNRTNLTVNSSNNEIEILIDSINRMQHKIKAQSKEKDRLISQLENSLSEVKTLQGILPICSICKNIRNDEGYYEKIEAYFHKHTGVDFSHTICQSCMKKHYPEEYESIMEDKF